MKLESAITNIENHFRTPGAVSYSHFKRACELEYGHNASAILESLKIAEHLKKRAGDTSVAWHLAPYKYLAQAVEAGQKMASARMEAAQFDAEYGDKLIDIVQMVVPRKKSASLTDGIHVLTEVSIAEAERMLYGEVKKAADDDGGFDMSPTGLLGRLSYDPDAHASKEQIKVMRKLTDPVHEGRLNVLRRRFMLTNLMANDPVIKSYEPDDVLHIYNQLTQLAPRASGQEMLVQSILRRQLAQGQTDPHEVSQLTDIENKMKTIAEPSDSRKLPYVVNKLKNA